MVEISSPLDGVDFGASEHRSRGCIEALRPWRNPELFSRGVPLGLVTSRVVEMMDVSTRGWGAV